MRKGKHTSRIGKDDERDIVKSLEKRGYRSRRQPGSGSVATDLHSDVVWFDSPAGKLLIEAKYRESCQWRNLLKWKAGADILTVRCDARKSAQDGQRYALLSWDLLLRLVGEAAERCSLSDLEGLETKTMDAVHEARSLVPEGAVNAAIRNGLRAVSEQRARIQSAHQNPPQKPKQPRKLKGRGFSKGKRA